MSLEQTGLEKTGLGDIHSLLTDDIGAVSATSEVSKTTLEPASNEVIQPLTLEFIEIESPLPPGIDWSSLLFLGGWSLLGLLLVILVLRLSQGLYQPQALRWQLKKLAQQSQSSQAVSSAAKGSANEGALSPSQVWGLFNWVQQLPPLMAQYVALESEEKGVALQQDYDALVATINQLSFSKADVSREAYQALLAKAHSLLNRLSSGSLLQKRLMQEVVQGGQFVRALLSRMFHQSGRQPSQSSQLKRTRR
ncbi:MAG: hypothetical protein GXO35_04365 [Gammaproteobacteria bacterium]|nr:hypothetical protein [Gammaproteobacteria bacterium]